MLIVGVQFLRYVLDAIIYNLQKMVSAAVDFDRAGSRRPTEHTRDLD